MEGPGRVPGSGMAQSSGNNLSKFISCALVWGCQVPWKNSQCSNRWASLQPRLVVVVSRFWSTSSWFTSWLYERALPTLPHTSLCLLTDFLFLKYFLRVNLFLVCICVYGGGLGSIYIHVLFIKVRSFRSHGPTAIGVWELPDMSTGNLGTVVFFTPWGPTTSSKSHTQTFPYLWMPSLSLAYFYSS